MTRASLSFKQVSTSRYKRTSSVRVVMNNINFHNYFQRRGMGKKQVVFILIFFLSFKVGNEKRLAYIIQTEKNTHFGKIPWPLYTRNVKYFYRLPNGFPLDFVFLYSRHITLITAPITGRR